ncbi:hypothetical protein CFter6_3192 [Collimonas fungivorans]|uniref:Uncharacterized protein n=1 Tax=Collimonas fungivorans TaxID=158899 RepID=A0A127PDF3_9BURK|nr:hypothetical protein CFter6_3192 [Collimonas fungivorans]
MTAMMQLTTLLTIGARKSDATANIGQLASPAFRTRKDSA